MKKWPNFFIVGAPRAGTTSLYEYLSDIDGIYMSPIKQPHFFSVSVDEKILLQRPFRKENEYLKLFENVKNETAIGEATPVYLWDPEAPKLIKEKVPDAKIIIILRDPVERAFSHYLLTVGFGQESQSFSNAIQKALNAKPDYSGGILESGFYGEQILRYMKFFDKNQIKIIIFEEFIKDTKSHMKEILDFLNVPAPLPENFKRIHNKFTVPKNKLVKLLIQNASIRHLVKNFLPRESGRQIKKLLDKEGNKPTMKLEDKIFLQKLYLEDSKKLEKLLNKKLPWNIHS